MDDVLLGIVVQRLDEKPLPAAAADILLAALDGQEALTAQFGGGRSEPLAEAAEPSVDPVGG
jgi:hypothetical protein